MIKVNQSSRFKKDFALMIRRGKDPEKFKVIVNLLLENINIGNSHNTLLPPEYHLHKIHGKFNGRWECHIEPDWLLVFYLDDEILKFERTGTHSDIF